MLVLPLKQVAAADLGGTMLAWLLALVVVNSWCVTGVAPGQNLTHTEDGNIILTQHATIHYFLDKLQQQHPVQLIPDTKILVVLRSDVRGHGVKINFQPKRDRKNSYLYRTKGKGDRSGVIVEGEISRLMPRATGKWGDSPFRLVGGVYEQYLMMENPDLNSVVEKRDKSLYIKHRNGRLYEVICDVCLGVKNPTECYFYWHPLEGIVGLAFNRSNRGGTMYHVDWNTIATVSRCKPNTCTYRIKVEHVKKEAGKTIEYFTNLLKAMKPLGTQMLSVSSTFHSTQNVGNAKYLNVTTFSTHYKHYNEEKKRPKKHKKYDIGFILN